MKKILKIKKFKFKAGKSLLKYLKKNKIIYSHWIENIFSKRKINIKEHEIYELFLINLKKDLNIHKTTTLKIVYKKLKEKNLTLVKPEIALYSATKIGLKKVGTWYRYATPFQSMIDSDNVPHLPKLGKALKRYFVETYWSYPGAIFHPHNEFLVCRY